MPVLKNPKHETMAQGLAQGLSEVKAYELAGYAPDEANANRLTKNDKIRTRVAEIQARGAARAEVTIESLMAECEEARKLALKLGQASAAVAATREKGVLSGKRVERTEVGEPGDFDRLTDDELRAVVRQDAEELGIVDDIETRH